MQDLVGDRRLASARLVFRQQDARELPVFGIETDGGRDHAGLACDLAVALDLGGKCACQVGIERNVLLFPIGKAGFAPLPLRASSATRVSIAARPKLSVTVL